MELSKKERLFLYNQYEILKLLNADDTDMTKMYETNQKILLNGYKRNYDDFVKWVSDDVEDDVSILVWDVFQMYSVIYDSYSQLDEEHKKLINENHIKFQGFDGNDEAEYYSYADFILKDLDRYAEIYNNGHATLNSHRNMVYTYKYMLQTWRDIRKDDYSILNFEQIYKIIG